MNTRPRPAPPGGAFHVAHTLTGNDATTLTLNVAEHWRRVAPEASSPIACEALACCTYDFLPPTGELELTS